MNETDNIPTPVTEQDQHDYHAEPMVDQLTEQDQLREYFRKIGRIGGRKRSDAKRAAARENARKANQARWGKNAPRTTAADPPRVPLELGPTEEDLKRKS